MVLAIACDQGLSDPNDGAIRIGLLPSFLVIPQPGTAPPDAGCGTNEGYQFSQHFEGGYNNRAEFDPPGTPSLRTACGDLPFDETEIGGVHLRYALIYDNYVEMWARRQRSAQPPLAFDDDSMYLGAVVGDSQHHLFTATAGNTYDLIAFAQIHGESLSVLGTNYSLPFTGYSDALAQLWREQPQPTFFSITYYTDSQPWLTWTNQHRGRTADSTEIYRKLNGGDWDLRARVGGSATSYVDGPLSAGGYSYFIRHVTALASEVNDNPPIARPASWATSAIAIATGAPPPTGPQCEGNFSATMDCRWWRSVANASSEILRGGVVKATLAGGAVNTLVQWTDSAVTGGQSYSYQVRHVVGGAPGRLTSPPHGAVASPVAPENLNCAGTEPGVISCVWVDKEPDTVLIERSNSGQGNWTNFGIIVAGTMYFSEGGLSTQEFCYRARHRRGAAYTAYSNIDCAVPGDDGPLGPDP